MARTKLAIALALAGAAFSSNAFALGLGAIEVKSALNQPLDARIPLLSVEVGELDSLSVSLASAEAFQRAGVDRPFSLTRLKFRVVSGEKPYIRVFTEQPVKEPFLDFLMEADWARGRLVREFTLLLDPPVFGSGVIAAPVRAAPIAPARSAAQESTSPPAADQGMAGAASPATAIAPLPLDPAQATVARATSYRPVSASDTLWKIAREVRPDANVSINQTMIALMRANPSAFINGDMNLIRRGATLQIPDAAVIAAVDAAQADREVREVAERWRRQQEVAQRSDDGRLQEVAQRSEGGRLQVLAPTGPSGEEVSSATEDGVASDAQDVAALQTQLKIAREATASLESENEDLKAQVEGLKAEVARFERLLSIQAQQPVVAPAEAVEETAQEPTAATDTAAQVNEAPAQDAAQPAAAVETPAAAAPEKPAVVEQPKPTPVVASGSESGFLDDPRNLGMLGGVALVLLGLVYLVVRRRRKPAPPVVYDAGPADPGIVVEEEPAQDFDFEDEVVNESAPATNPLEDMPPDGDALSEADVYLAYGRYDQARELLEKALRNEPDSTAFRLKLLEIIGLMHDVDAFANQARLLRDQVGVNSDSWQRVAQMGRDLLPGDPMFAEASSSDYAASAESAEPASDDSFGGFQLDDTELAPVAAQVEEDVATSSSDEFSLDFDLPESTATAEPAESFSLDFDDSPAVAEEPAAKSKAADDDGLSFELDDLSFDEEPARASNVLEFAQPSEPEDASEIDELDEAGVKLDLARAYLDMGDSEGARNLLDEVLEEGSNRQRQEAQDLLKQIA